MKTIHRSRSSRQRGAALLTAMIIVALVATLASAMVWQQWRAVQVEAAERARAQSAWILIGARDFAGLILKATRNGPTALTDEWAVPLKEARLSTFLAVDKSNADDGPEAFLSGYVNDAQARFNLRNLVASGKIDLDALDVFKRLCDNLNLDSSIAGRVANGLLSAIGPTSGGGEPGSPLEPITVAQLTWLGIDQSSVTKLQPYVILLAGPPTAVNVNTASKEVLAAAVNTNPGNAERLMQMRQRAPFKSVADFMTRASIQVGSGAPPKISVESAYFEVSGSLRLADHVLTERSLVQRAPNGSVTPLQRERIAALDQTDR